MSVVIIIFVTCVQNKLIKERNKKFASIYLTITLLIRRNPQLRRDTRPINPSTATVALSTYISIIL